MQKSVAAEIVKARRAVNVALAKLSHDHGPDTVRAAVGRWLETRRAERKALAEIRAAEKKIQELRRTVGR